MGNQPNLFHFSGDDLQISYSSSGFDGKPQFGYHDSSQSRSFSGDQIKVEETVVGTLVSVTTVQTVDAGSTTFSLVIPTIHSVPASGTVTISTIGITTIHKFKLFGTEPGQASFTTVKPLQGTGMNVVFMA